MDQVVSIPPWFQPLLTGMCVALFTWVMGRVSAAKAESDKRFQAIETALNEHKLSTAKEYFSADQASILSQKLDQIVAELHSQNVVLTEVKTELRASRQATAMASAAQHLGGHS